MTLSQCNSSCSAGYSCTPDSPSAVAVVCPSGSYCPAGIVNGTFLTCPNNTYSIGGAAACTPCRDGTVTSTAGAGECLTLTPIPVWTGSATDR